MIIPIDDNAIPRAIVCLRANFLIGCVVVEECGEGVGGEGGEGEVGESKIGRASCRERV